MSIKEYIVNDGELRPVVAGEVDMAIPWPAEHRRPRRRHHDRPPGRTCR
jgi:hypothetical protein